MRASGSLVVEAAYAAWAAQDLAATLRCFADDVVFVIHIPSDVAPFMGEAHGKAQLEASLAAIIDTFHFVAYVPLLIRADGDAFHSNVSFHYRHKATGLEYDGTMRHVWRVEADRIVRFEEFHDAERVRSFFRLLEQRTREA